MGVFLYEFVFLFTNCIATSIVCCVAHFDCSNTDEHFARARLCSKFSYVPSRPPCSRLKYGTSSPKEGSCTPSIELVIIANKVGVVYFNNSLSVFICVHLWLTVFVFFVLIRVVSWPLVFNPC